jgi:hypothetical protein
MRTASIGGSVFPGHRFGSSKQYDAIIFCLYAPTKARFDKVWKLPDIEMVN